MRGFASGQVVILNISSLFNSLTTKHTVNQGLRIVSFDHSEHGGCTLTISLYNALTNFRNYDIAQ
jgi:hypothetical protein